MLYIIMIILRYFDTYTRVHLDGRFEFEYLNTNPGFESPNLLTNFYSQILVEDVQVRIKLYANYTRNPEIEIADLSQSHVGLNFRLIVYCV